MTKKDPEKITVVVMSRLVYRKGIDLLVDVIPIICENFPDVNFIIGGDGPMRAELGEMIDQCELHDRVEMLGAQSHSEVRDVLGTRIWRDEGRKTNSNNAFSSRTHFPKFIIDRGILYGDC